LHTDNIIHKSEAISDLYELINSDRFPHALLLKGAGGRGKLAIARSLAQYLVCTDRKNGDSCGVCSHCHKSLKNIHPDIHFSFPINGAKATCNDFMIDFRAFIDQNHYASGSDWITEMSEGKKAGNII